MPGRCEQQRGQTCQKTRSQHTIPLVGCIAWSCHEKSGKVADCSGAIAKQWLQKKVDLDRKCVSPLQKRGSPPRRLPAAAQC
jgi:hypothetical protein